MIMSNAEIIWFYSQVIKFKRLLVLAHLLFWNDFLVSLKDGDIYWFKLPSDWKGLFHGTESGDLWRKFQCGSNIPLLHHKLQKPHTAGDSLAEFRIRKVPQPLLASMEPSGCWDLQDWTTEHQTNNKGTQEKPSFGQGFELKWPRHHFLVFAQHQQPRVGLCLWSHVPAWTQESNRINLGRN